MSFETHKDEWGNEDGQHEEDSAEGSLHDGLLSTDLRLTVALVRLLVTDINAGLDLSLTHDIGIQES